VTEVVLVVAAYLAGSLPFGYWLVRIFRGADIRTLGSKNTGATNVWRNFGWRFGVATLLLDAAKGALPVAAALHWSGPLTGSIAGIAAMLGHGYPVLLGFGGGLSAWSRQVVVEERRWMNDAEFLSAMTVCRLLPGRGTHASAPPRS